MRKIFINKKYLDNCRLEEGGVFHLTPEMILSSYAQDFFIQKQIKLVENSPGTDNTASCSAEINTAPQAVSTDVYKCIKEILSMDYGFPSHIVEEITQRVLKEINK